MTSRAQKAFNSLPPKVMAQIERLARRLKERPEVIVEKAVQLFDDSHGTIKGRTAESRKAGANPLEDPNDSIQFKRIMSAMAKRTAEGMTSAQKKARGKAGGAGRARKLTATQRKEIARNAAVTRWAKVQNGG